MEKAFSPSEQNLLHAEDYDTILDIVKGDSKSLYLRKPTYMNPEHESEEVKMKIIDLVNILFGFLSDPEIDQLLELRAGTKIDDRKSN